MALVNCPECNKEISDSAKQCPSCGYEIQKEITRSELGEIEKNPAQGMLCIFVGIIAIIFGFLTIGIIIGIFAIIGGFAFIGMGALKISGTQKGLCPYCNNELTVKHNAVVNKCPHCKKTSKKLNNYLEKID